MPTLGYSKPMRLSETRQRIIRDEVVAAFGDNAVVQLFGSRLDDDRRGGDLDLYVEADGTPGQRLRAELALYARLQRRLGEQRIDIVVHGRDEPLRPIDIHAQATGVTL